MAGHFTEQHTLNKHGNVKRKLGCDFRGGCPMREGCSPRQNV